MGNANQRGSRDRSARAAESIHEAARSSVQVVASKPALNQPVTPMQQFMAAKMESSLAREGREFVKEEYVAIALQLLSRGARPQSEHILQMMEMTVPQLRQVIRSAIVLESSNGPTAPAATRDGPRIPQVIMPGSTSESTLRA
jgi:hypothetical protein